jgi:hypothetical protein
VNKSIRTTHTNVLRGNGRKMRRIPRSSVYPLVDDTKGEWRKSAACAGQDPRVWTKNHNRRSVPQRLKDVCAECPVSISCLNEGLNECRMSSRTSDTVGTRAGTSAHMRHDLYRAWLEGNMGAFREELLSAGWCYERALGMIAQLPGRRGE